MWHLRLWLSTAKTRLQSVDRWYLKHFPDRDARSSFLGATLHKLALRVAEHFRLQFRHDIRKDLRLLRICRVTIAVHEGLASARVPMQIGKQHNLVLLVELCHLFFYRCHFWEQDGVGALPRAVQVDACE